MGTARESRRGTTKGGRFPDSSAWDRTGFLLWHAVLEWRRKVTEGLADVGLTHVQFVLLASAMWLAHHGEEPSQVELAGHAGMDPMMTSQVARSLERSKLVRRVADKDDARVRRIVVTAAGERIVLKAVSIVEAMDHEVFGEIKDVEAFRKVLRSIARRDADGNRSDGE
jgi:DNA-binding MarR family transcriptional regulator